MLTKLLSFLPGNIYMGRIVFTEKSEILAGYR